VHDDTDFLRKLLDNPADDTARLVYADWLDEQADELSRRKATFLRETVALVRIGKKQRQKRKLLLRQLQAMAAELDTDWLAVVSRLKVENCAVKREEWQLRYSQLFEFVCDRQWEEMAPTEDTAVRSCTDCKQNVHYCDTITVARDHARQGHCVAIDLGIIRRDGDLASPRMMMGRVSPRFLQEEEERSKPDPVSEAREQRKREQGGDS
jgi:uncharacterized protein (TIGR02996 family)